MLPLRTLPADEEAKLLGLFPEQPARHDREIVENCEVSVVEVIELEHVRRTYTDAQAEEITMRSTPSAPGSTVSRSATGSALLTGTGRRSRPPDAPRRQGCAWV